MVRSSWLGQVCKDGTYADCVEDEHSELWVDLNTQSPDFQKQLEEFYAVFMRKLWCLEMVNFIEVLEGIGCFVFWDVCLSVTVNLERIWH